MHEIKYPPQKKWFIANTGGIYSHGAINTDQVMSTGLENIEVFTDEKTYLERISDLHIKNTSEDTS